MKKKILMLLPAVAAGILMTGCGPLVAVPTVGGYGFYSSPPPPPAPIPWTHYIGPGGPGNGPGGNGLIGPGGGPGGGPVGNPGMGPGGPGGPGGPEGPP